jgi:hypothetical protein
LTAGHTARPEIFSYFLHFSFISAVEVSYVFCCKLIAMKTSQCLKRREKRIRPSNPNLMSVKGLERY